MQNTEINIREIRSLTIKGIAWSYLPFFLISLTIPWLETLPEVIDRQGLSAIAIYYCITFLSKPQL